MTGNKSGLLPCPFCGGKAEIYRVIIRPGTFYAWCDECETRSNYYNTEEDAARAWNSRAERTCRAICDGDDSGHEFAGESWHCSNCGHEMDEYEAKCGAYCIKCGAKVVSE